jgi:twitching motility protein PilT
MAEPRDILSAVVQANASDLFVKVGMPAAMRVAGKVKYLTELGVITNEFAQKFFDTMATPRVRKLFEEHLEADASYEEKGVGRFRVNIFQQRSHIGFVLRYVKYVVPSMEDLRLPSKTLCKIAGLQRGLVLVTGIAGSGKSTTLASMLKYINSTMEKHIVTIEDPIEFMFNDEKSLINQRELGIDTPTFISALKHVVRQSPDIIMIGEMRDIETVETAINAAETGHLVFSTLHTMNCMQTIERIMNIFPPYQHEFLRKQLSLLMRGVISQRLIPTKDGKARVPAIEIMVDTPTIKELLHEGKFRDIYKAIKEGNYFGCQTFNQSLKELYQSDLITVEEALAATDNPDEFKLELRGIQKGARSSDFEFKNY